MFQSAHSHNPVPLKVSHGIRCEDLFIHIDGQRVLPKHARLISGLVDRLEQFLGDEGVEL